jgi:hypothetical protein
VTSIGNAAFGSCVSLKSIIIPNSVTTIGWGAFGYCASLKTIEIPNSVTNLGDFPFESCASLTTVKIPDSVTVIGESAFDSCVSLTTINIPNTVTRIGTSAFYDCASLTNINVPSSVTSIGPYAFAYCANLKGIFFHGNAPGFGGTFIFDNSPGATVYYLPGTTGWNSPFLWWCPKVLWNPQFQFGDFSSGVRTNRFSFKIIGAPNIPVVLETCTNLATPNWVTLQSFTITNGLLDFSDPQWTNYPGRYYRLRSP